ncbi:MAG: membrane protein insertase YidC, partial [Burkholderiaceae bacterium]
MKNDFRSSLLFAVFFMSLLMLWDHWRIANGEPSMLAPRPSAVAAATRPVAADASRGAIPAGPVSGAQAADGAVAELAAQRVTIQTDVVKATLDTRG